LEFFEFIYFLAFHLLKVIFIFIFFEKEQWFFIEGWGCFVFMSMIFKVLLKFDNYIVIVDHMCVERVILIWMLLSVTLGNSFLLHITS